MTVGKFRIKVNLQNLLIEAANTCQTPAISTGFGMADMALKKIMYRTLELLKEGKIESDDVLIQELVNISYIEENKNE
jgi:hypothetical protein